MLVFQNNATAGILVFQTNPMGVELFSNANAFSGHVVENALLAQNEPWYALLTTRVIKIYVICYSAWQNPMRIYFPLCSSPRPPLLKNNNRAGEDEKSKAGHLPHASIHVNRRLQ